MPQISVVVPVYNVEKYIHRCVDSIINQTFTDFELILVDDGSPDNCGSICDQYSEKDRRIKVIHRENGGLSAARNSGIEWSIENSNSEWITFIDSDDWVHPRYLEVLLNECIKTNCEVGLCNSKEANGYIDYHNVLSYDIKTFEFTNLFVELNGDINSACSKLYKKHLFNEHRYPEGKIHEDVFLTYKILFEAKGIVYIDCQLHYYFKGNVDSIMTEKYSLKRLAQIEAGEQQVDFFTQINNLDVLSISLKRMMYCYAYHLQQLKTISEGKPYVKPIKKKLVELLKTKSKFCGVNIQNSPFYYEQAFPMYMSFYWKYKKVLSLLKK